MKNKSFERLKKELKEKGTWWKHRGDRAAQSARYYKDRKLEKSAHQKVYAAVKSGKLKRPRFCSMCGGGTYIQGHHNDYRKPLLVIWVCWCCHMTLHQKRRKK